MSRESQQNEGLMGDTNKAFVSLWVFISYFLTYKIKYSHLVNIVLRINNLLCACLVRCCSYQPLLCSMYVPMHTDTWCDGFLLKKTTNIRICNVSTN